VPLNSKTAEKPPARPATVQAEQVSEPRPLSEPDQEASGDDLVEGIKRLGEVHAVVEPESLRVDLTPVRAEHRAVGVHHLPSRAVARDLDLVRTPKTTAAAGPL
jgi:hypothetical protein